MASSRRGNGRLPRAAPAGRGVCYHFQRTGQCKFGYDCKFSHDVATTANSTQEPSNGAWSITPDSNDSAELLRRWRFKIPRNTNRVTPLKQDELVKFFEHASQLVKTGAETMQIIINTLASPEGLIRLRELLRQNWEEQDDETLAKIVPPLLELFRILSEDEVRQSAVIETRYGNLLNELYGIGGQQAAPIFSATVRYLTSDDHKTGVELAIAAFAYMLEKTDVAMVSPALQSVAEALLTLLDSTTVRSRSTQRHIRTVRTKLRLATEVEEVDIKATKSTTGPKATFEIDLDFPGDLSDNGPRHDNDHASISDISILPTSGEIQSTRSEYLPREDPSQWHLPGVEGLLDRQFRLIREDTVGQIRDAIKSVLDTSRGAQGAARTHVYSDVRLERVAFDDQRGLLFVLSIDQPANIANKSPGPRRTWWEESGRLSSDSLICVLSAADGTAFFLAVHSPRKNTYRGSEDDEDPIHEQYTLCGERERAFVVAELTTPEPEAATKFLKAFTVGDGMQQPLIVEFPGILLAAFGPTLAALQNMSQTQDLPFIDLLVPNNPLEPSPPPAYSQKAGFKFDLSCLATDKDTDPGSMAAISSAEIESALERTSLDDTQRKAVSHALTNSMALIQGPPGTGKSYTVIKMIRALLANRDATEIGPIVCVCFTNHALDQLLEHLVDADVKQMVRIGAGSKSQRLAAINLRKLSFNAGSTRMENDERWHLKCSIGNIGPRISGLVGGFHNIESTVLAWLRSHQSDVHAQLSDPDENGFQRVTGKKTTLQAWLEGGSRSRRSRSLQELLQIKPNIFTLTREERRLLYRHWTEQAIVEACDDIEIQLQDFYDTKDSLDSLRGGQDLRILQQASVIGITTTGLARNLKLLRKLKSKVLVVEEAGEVLEAHLLTALLPSLEHAVLIGDHLQLRPKVGNYELSVENQRSSAALDISLFERLVHPRGDSPQGLPYITLETQRRMHPSVSQLIRSTLYPRLVDGPNVSAYPEVVGMRKRLFWFDHSKSEDGQNQQHQATSHTNAFEVEMVTVMVRHLQRQGEYKSSDIAVLTPYLGQLRKLQQKLGGILDVVLNNRDVDELNGVKDGEEPSLDELARRPSVTKGKLTDALRLATVDNFQGEEAKVIIISLVRSNKQRKCGFLRTSNRINVLLSRAKHGMYIIGNAATSSTVEMWQDVIDILKEDGNIGTTLELACPRHLETPLPVKEPEDFQVVSPQAGCQLMCGKQLSFCGHSCPMNCHSEALHNAVHCMKDCPRPKKGCEHPCRLVCGDDCPQRCEEIVDCDIQLDCGHQVTSLPCYLYQDQSKVQCDVVVEKTVPGCEHKVMLPCRQRVDNGSYHCIQKCAALSECGHLCGKMCYHCTKRDTDGTVINVDHGKCRSICGKPYTSCQHDCQALCHGGDDNHPLCQEPCDIRCAHSKCPKKCSDPCTPCAEEKCTSHCPHSTCQLPCAAPCDWVPCTTRCEKILACSHRCPSLCGEACPPAEMCQECTSEEVKNTRVDLITFESYQEVDLDKTPCLFLPCGHIFTAETLDMQLEMKLHYEMDDSDIPVAVKGAAEPFSVEKMKSCPDCRGSLREVARYGRIVRRSLIDINTKKFIIWSNRMYVDLAERLRNEQADLIKTKAGARLLLDHFVIGNDLPKALKSTGSRYKTLLQLRSDIYVFLRDVRKEEQPYGKVHNLVKAARRRQLDDSGGGMAIAEFAFDADNLQTRGQLLAMALKLRCDLIALTDLLTMWESMPAQKRSRLEIDLSKYMTACEELLASATESKNVLQETEAHIFWAHFAALEFSVATSEGCSQEKIQSMEALKQQGKTHLNNAQDLCDKFPGQTKTVTDEVKGVRKMLEDFVSSNEMRMVVAAMQKEFSGTGHWYYCVNRHPFTVGECGMPMELARCPQCGAAIGGQEHETTAGVTHASDIEETFGEMRI